MASSSLEETSWKLVFQDEFNDNRLDQSKWNTQDPWGDERNNELQAYTSDRLVVRGGFLSIIADRGSAIYDGESRNYVSGILTTYQKFSLKYGRVEVRVRVPRGAGLWPAVWLLADSLKWPPEIDVLEILGHDPKTVHFANHWGSDWRQHQSLGGTLAGVDFSSDFHVVQIDWSPGLITWSVDGEESFHSTSNIPDQPMFLLMNLAVGGDWPGAPNKDTVFPASFSIDYVRVYSH